MAATSRDVAKLAGVSPATVSLVLHGKGKISEETRRKVLQAAETLGLQPSQLVRNQQMPVIQLVIFIRNKHLSIYNPTVDEMILAAKQCALTTGYHLVISYFYSSQNPDEQLRSISSTGCAGIVLFATEMEFPEIELFERLGVPIVLLDSPLMQHRYNTVSIDNQRGMYWAVEYLIRHGHTQIGYLHATAKVRDFRERKQGFLAALRQLPDNGGTHLSKPYILPMCITSEGACKNMTELLAADLVLPTAFVADSDNIARGCIEALHKFGYRVPEDVSIIGFEGLPFSAKLDPPLTTMAVPLNAMCRYCIECIAAAIEGRASVARFRLLAVPELVERSSVRKI